MLRIKKCRVKFTPYQTDEGLPVIGRTKAVLVAQGGVLGICNIMPEGTEQVMQFSSIRKEKMPSTLEVSGSRTKSRY